MTPGTLRVLQIDGAIGIGKSALIVSALSATRAPSFLSHGDRLAGRGPLGGHRAMIETLLGEDLEQLLHEETPRTLALRCAAALDGPHTVIAVDDAQWLDPASEDFLVALMLAPVQTALTIVLVHRAGQEPANLLAQARRRGAVHDQLTIGALPDDVIAELVSGLNPQQRAVVVEAATGNPLFALTAMAAFRRHPEARYLHEVLRLGDASPSAVLSAAVADDVASLPSPARRVLETLAVLGRGLDLAALSAVSGLAQEDCAAGLRLLEAHGLLSPNPHEALHPVVRLSVYQNTDPSWRAAAHRAAAHVPGADLLQRAEHLALLGPEVSAAEADLLVRAATLALGSEPRAVLRWLDGLPQHSRDSRAQTLLARAEILDGQVATAITRLRPLAERTGASTEVKVLLANALRMANQPDEARAILADETETVEPELLREMIDVVALLDDGVPEHLLATLERLPGEENQMAAAIYRTMERLGAGAVSEGREVYRGVPEWVLGASSDAVRETLHAVACAVWCAYMLDEYEAGSRIGLRGLHVAQRHGQADVLPNLRSGLAFCLAQLGRLEEADAAIEQALVEAERYGTPDVVGMARAGHVISALGRRDRALLRERYEALRETELPRFAWWRRAVQGIRIRTSALVGEPEPYTALLGMARDAMTGLHHADAALVAAVGGDPAVAVRLIEEGLAITREQGAHGQEAILRTTLAEILLEAGGRERAEQARELLLAAQETFEQRGMGLQRGRVGAGLARVEEVLARTADPLAALTPREREVAGLISQGLTNREIATRLVISPRTAEEHVAKIMRKLGVPSRAAVGTLLSGGTHAEGVAPIG